MSTYTKKTLLLFLTTIFILQISASGVYATDSPEFLILEESTNGGDAEVIRSQEFWRTMSNLWNADDQSTEDSTFNFQTCDNVQDGGAIGIDQSSCGATFDPEVIHNISQPSGGSGTIQYLWLKSTTTCAAPNGSNDNEWHAISGADGSSYDPGPISETTCYIRCARRQGCSTYDGESNVVTIEVLSDGVSVNIPANNTSLCNNDEIVLSAEIANASNCGTQGESQCDHSLESYGGWVEDPSHAAYCGQAYGAKLWTQAGEGTSYVEIDFEKTVSAGTKICVNMKLVHCSNTSDNHSSAKIRSRQSGSNTYSTLVSSKTFSQDYYKEFCYTLGQDARYIKVSDNGSCAFRVDYVRYETLGSQNSAVTYAWTGPGIVGSNDKSTVTVGQSGTYEVEVTDCNGCKATDAIEITGNSFTANAGADKTICKGESASLSTTYVSGATYKWRVLGSSTGISTNREVTVTPTETTTYEVTVSKDGCEDSDDVIVEVWDAPIVTDIMVSNKSCNDLGSISFFFEDNINRTHIEFSIDGGNSYPYSSSDDVGSFTIENLGVESYNVFVRWGNDQCPVSLGTAIVEDKCNNEEQFVNLQDETFKECDKIFVEDDVSTNDSYNSINGEEDYTLLSEPSSGILKFNPDGTFRYENSIPGTYKIDYELCIGTLADTPPTEQCQGGIKTMKVEYLGVSGSSVVVSNKDGSDVLATFNNVQNGDILTITNSSGTYNGQYNNWKFKVNGSDNTLIHTSCSVPILGRIFGDFYVLEYVNPNSTVNSMIIEICDQATATIVIGDSEATINEVAALCSNDDPIQLIASPSGGTFSGTGVSSSGLFTPSAAQIGDNVITYSYTADSGCSVSAQITIVVEESADAGTIAGNEENCGSYNGSIITSTTDPSGSDCGGIIFTGENCCDNGSKPISMTFIYNGAPCTSSNGQGDNGGKWACTGDASGQSNVYISTNVVNAPAFVVSSNQSFTVLTGSNDNLPNPIELTIYDQEGGNQLQYIEVHTSCSAPIIVGDQFGSLVLAATEFDDGYSCGSDESLSVKWEQKIGSGEWTVIEGANGFTYDPGIISSTTKFRRSASNCCGFEYSNVVTKTVLEPIYVEIDPAGPFCADDNSVQLTGSPSGGTFSGTGVSSSGLFTPSAAQLGDNVITYSNSNGSGCSGSAQTTIVVNESADAGSITGNEENCGTYDGSVITSSSDPSGSDCGGIIVTGENCCDNGSKPISMTFIYNGAPCASSNGQGDNGGKWTCTGDASGQSNVYITTNVVNAPAFVASSNQSFTVSTGSNDNLPNPIELTIYDQQGGNQLQYIEVHTSCSAPIIVGDQFGSLVLAATEFDDGYSCGSDESLSIQWEQKIGSGEWTVIEGANGFTYDPGLIYTTTKFRRSASNCCGSDYSNVVTKTVFAPIFANAGSDQNICVGFSANLKASVGLSGEPNGFILRAQPESTASDQEIKFKKDGVEGPRLLLYINGNSSPVTLLATQRARIESVNVDHNHDDPKVGYDGSEYDRSLLGFDISGITGTINQAKLVLNSETDATLAVGVYAAPAAWNGEEVTWEKRASGTTWNTPGGIEPGSPLLDVKTITAKGPVMWDVTALVDAWVNGDSNNGGNYTYQWSNGLGSGNMKTVSPNTTTTYTVTVTDSNGCSDSDQVTVEVSNEELDPGEIGVNQDNCSAFDPDEITSIIDPTGVCDISTEEDCCENGDKPVEFTLFYNGGSCADSQNSQGEKGGKWDCTGDAADDPQVYITVEGTDFSGVVNLNGTFTVTAGGGNLPNPTVFSIYSSQGGSLLQTVEIHTSCSAPIVAGDQFGSLVLLGTKFENGYECEAINGALLVQWQSKVEGGEWTDLEGETSLSYDPPFTTQTTKFRREVTNCCGSAYSNEVLIEVIGLATVGDFVFTDVDNDGIQDPEDTGLDGVTVTLYQSDGTFEASTTTMNGGAYSFEVCSGEYYIVFGEVDNHVRSPKDQTTDDDDSDADPVTGRTDVFTLNPGDNNKDVDAGYSEIIDLELIKSVSKSFPNVEELIDYTITVVNKGPSNATNVQVTDIIPNGIGGVTNISGLGSFANDLITWSNLSIAEGETITLSYSAAILAVGNGISYVNVAEITAADQRDVDSTPNNGADTNGNGEIGPLDDDGSQDPDDEDDGDDARVAPFTADISIEKATNGLDSDLPPGQVIAFINGTEEEVEWTYEVTNNGGMDLVDVIVTDNVEGYVCTIPSLLVGETQECTKLGIAMSGLYANVGDVIGTPVDPYTGDPIEDMKVTDEDPSHYRGVRFNISSTATPDSICAGDSVQIQVAIRLYPNDDGSTDPLLQLRNINFSSEALGQTLVPYDQYFDPTNDLNGDGYLGQDEFEFFWNYGIIVQMTDTFFQMDMFDIYYDDQLIGSEMAVDSAIVTVDNGLCSGIGDLVWEDIAGGTPDVYDPGTDLVVSGVNVMLFKEDPNNPGTFNMVAQQQTTGLGYFFDNLSEGKYYVKFTAPSGFNFVNANQGGNEEFDSDANSTTGETAVIMLPRDTIILSVDAGLRRPPLPVELVSFSGKWNADRDVNELKWMTASEINNDYFLVERSIGSTSEFAQIAKVAGNGTTNATQNYTLDDRSLSENGIYFYRLKQFDYDGSFAYSDIIGIRVERIKETGVTIYPNPSRDFVNVSITTDVQEDVIVRLFDMVGRHILTETLRAGDVNYDNKIMINVSDLPSGLYNIMTTVGNEVFNEQIDVIK